MIPFHSSKQSPQFNRTVLIFEVECLTLNWSVVRTVCLWRWGEWSSLNQPLYVSVSVVEQKAKKNLSWPHFRHLTENHSKKRNYKGRWMYLLFLCFSTNSCITLYSYIKKKTFLYSLMWDNSCWLLESFPQSLNSSRYRATLSFIFIHYHSLSFI